MRTGPPPPEAAFAIRARRPRAGPHWEGVRPRRREDPPGKSEEPLPRRGSNSPPPPPPHAPPSVTPASKIHKVALGFSWRVFYAGVQALKTPSTGAVGDRRSTAPSARPRMGRGCPQLA